MGRRGRFFELGEVRLALLSLLSEGSKHGYQLMKELEDWSQYISPQSAALALPVAQIVKAAFRAAAKSAARCGTRRENPPFPGTCHP